LAARACPNCLTVVPAGEVAAHSNDLVCRNCKKPLAISDLSRDLAVFLGLIAGTVVWWGAAAHYSREANPLGWVLPILFGYLALSIVTPAVLMLTADLRLKPDEPVKVSRGIPAAHPTH
jgi:hypothetical protein